MIDTIPWNILEKMFERESADRFDMFEGEVDGSEEATTSRVVCSDIEGDLVRSLDISKSTFNKVKRGSNTVGIDLYGPRAGVRLDCVDVVFYRFETENDEILLESELLFRVRSVGGESDI